MKRNSGGPSLGSTRTRTRVCIPRGGSRHRGGRCCPRRAFYDDVADALDGLGSAVHWLRMPLLALAIVFGVTGRLTAQETGSTAATVLRFAPSPRALALGGAYSALADEVSIFYNPARLAVATPAVGASYRSLPVETGLGSTSFALRMGPGTVGGGVQYLNYGEVEVFEPDPASGGEIGIPTGERVGGGELAVTFGYGWSAPGGVQIGAAAKLLRLQLAEAVATGAAFDFGAGFELLDDRLTLGAAVQNLGADLGPVRASPLPRWIRAGAALHIDGPAGLRGTLVAEAIEGGGTVTPAIGFEAGLEAPGDALLVGRFGYDGTGTGDGQAGRWPAHFAVGAGLILDGLTLDYAHRSLGVIGTAHVFGLSLRLGARD